MLNGNIFYHETIRKYTVAFGSLINSIHLQRKDSSGNVISDTQVKVAFGPRSAYWATMNEDISRHNGPKAFAADLPRITFNFEGLQYDGERQMNPIVPVNGTPSGNLIKKTFNPVPYNFTFIMSIFVENIEDGLQILEQVIPYFTPTYNLVIKEMPSLDFSRDVPVLLESISLEDNYENGFNENRLIRWDLDFTLKGYMYYPVTDVSTIKSATVNINATPDMLTQLESIGIDVVPTTATAADPHTINTTIA
jgi:hypothetical protein